MTTWKPHGLGKLLLPTAVAVAALVLTGTLAACSPAAAPARPVALKGTPSGATPTAASPSPSPTAGGELLGQLEISSIFPSYLAVSASMAPQAPTPTPAASPASGGESSLGLLGDTSLSLTTLSDHIEKQLVDRSVSEKIEHLGKLLAATDAEQCKPRVVFKAISQPNCFGQRVTSQSGQVDSDSPLIRIPTELKGFNTTSARGFKTGQTLITQEKEGQEACFAASSQFAVAQISDYADRALGLLASLTCVAKLEGKARFPNEGRVDLKADVRRVWALPKEMEVQEALLERPEDHPEAFRFFLKMKLVSPNGESRLAAIDLMLSPDPKLKDSAKGRLVMLETGQDATRGDKIGALTLNFVKAEDSLRMKALKADFVSGLNPLEAMDAKTGYFDLSDGTRNDRIINLQQGIFALNAREGTGDYSIAFSANNAESASRMLVVNLFKDGDGNHTACGVAGFSEKFDTGSTGKLKGMHCAWGQEKLDGTSLDDKFAPLTQKQCLQRKSGASVWTVSSQKLKYVAAEDCGKDSTDAKFQGWTSLEGVSADGLMAGEVSVPKPPKVPEFPLKKDEIKLK